MFKTEEVKKRFPNMHPVAIAIMFDMYLYCMERKLEFVVTETVSTELEDDRYGRRTSTHRTGRAFDLRNKSWGLEDIQKFYYHFNEKYKRFKPIDSKGEKLGLVVSYPHGTGPHFHVQIHAKYSI